MFEADGIERRVSAGEFTVIVLRSHSASPLLGMPAGTVSQLIAYLDREGKTIAKARRYLKPDGSLGASGRADPKALIRDDVLYRPWWGTRLGDTTA